MISILWVAYGYSLAFSANGAAALTPSSAASPSAMLAGVDINTMAATFSKESLPSGIRLCDRSR